MYPGMRRPGDVGPASPGSRPQLAGLTAVMRGAGDDLARPRHPGAHRPPPAGRRPPQRGRERLLHGRRQRDRLRRRRIRLGQIRHRAHRHGTAAAGTAHADRRPHPARRRRPAAEIAGGAAPHARRPHGDDLPGADDRAQPGDARRRADRGGAGRSTPTSTRASRRKRVLDTHGVGAPARHRAPDRRLSAPALRRPAPAHHDRGRARARSRAADRRRADDRARRHHAGADPAS